MRVSAAGPPSGVVTFLFTDVEGSTRRWEADAAVHRLATAPTDDLVVRDVMLLRLRALLAKTRGDETAYRDNRDRYRDMARTLGFEGHIAWAEAIP